MANISQTASLKLIFSIYSLLPGVQIKRVWTHDHFFYADLALHQELNPELISLLETTMSSIEDIRFRDMMASNAAELFSHVGQLFFAEEMRERGGELVIIAQTKNGYASASSDSLEEGVHKILSCAKVDDGFRISAVAASDKQKLKKVLKQFEAGAEVDHRKLGDDLFFANEGSFLFTPRGSVVYQGLVSWWRARNSGNIISSFGDPTAAHSAIFRHLDPSEGDLPLTLAELHPVICAKNNLNSLIEPSSYTHDTTHIFTTEHQAAEALTSSLLFIDKTFMMLGLEVQWHLTEESQAFTGTQTSWSQGVQKLRDALQAANFQWEPRSFDHDTHGPAAYITLPDAIGQRWEVGILTLNCVTPDNLKLKYHGPENLLHTPIMIERSLFFSIERIIALQLEYKNGLLPTWLAAEQVRLLPIAERHQAQATTVLDRLKAAGVRATIDLRTDPLGAKIHAAETARVPWMLVIGDQEVQTDSLAVRRCGDPQPKAGVKWETFLREILAETKSPRMEQTGDQRVKLEDK